jgi:hypothetical protein
VTHALGFVFERVRSLTFVFCRSPGAPSGSWAETSLRRPDQTAQCRIDGLLVRETLRYVWRKQHKIRSRTIARDIFAAHPTLQFRKIVFSAQLVTLFSFLSLFLHTVLVRAASTVNSVSLPAFPHISTVSQNRLIPANSLKPLDFRHSYSNPSLPV